MLSFIGNELNMFLGMNSFNMIPWSAPTNNNHWLTEDIVAVFKFESATKIKQNQIRQDSQEMFGNSVDLQKSCTTWDVFWNPVNGR